MSFLPRLRLLFGRRPWLHPLLVGIAVLAAWWQATALQSDAAHARDAWGTTRNVWVADAASEPGDPIRAHPDRYPTALVPRDAITDQPDAAVATRSVSAGAVITRADLANPRAVPEGWVAFALPPDAAGAVQFGDDVAVFSQGRRVCNGRVGMVDATVEIAVPAGCAAALSDAVANDDAVLARMP